MLRIHVATTSVTADDEGEAEAGRAERRWSSAPLSAPAPPSSQRPTDPMPTAIPPLPSLSSSVVSEEGGSRRLFFTSPNEAGRKKPLAARSFEELLLADVREERAEQREYRTADTACRRNSRTTSSCRCRCVAGAGVGFVVAGVRFIARLFFSLRPGLRRFVCRDAAGIGSRAPASRRGSRRQRGRNRGRSE